MAIGHTNDKEETASNDGLIPSSHFDTAAMSKSSTTNGGPADGGALADEELVDTHCGFSSCCQPTWMQRCANPKVYLFVISLCTIIQGFAVNGINNVNIASYERRYLLTSKDSSLVASMYDIAAGLSVVFVGYFGAKRHQPRILGAAVICLGLGCLIMSIAHFAAPPYEPGDAGNSLVCGIVGAANITESAPQCDQSAPQSYLKNYLYVLLLGQAFNGFGGTCLYSIGVTYLDESVSAKMSPLYIGIMSGASIFGPAIGYILGGYLLELYVEPLTSPPKGLTKTDPAWVGAWWLGFVISSILSFILATFLFLFPKEMPQTKAIRAAKVSQAYDNGSEDIVNSVGFGISWKDMPRATWFLIRNPTFMFITGVVAVELIIAAGMSTFLPKLIANQFAQPAGWAAMLTGFMAVPGAALGQVVGGFICKKLDLKIRGMLTLTIISSVIATLATPVFWARCSDSALAGVELGYPGMPTFNKKDGAQLSASCNSGCGCTTAIYQPVCADGVQYFSPCHAGCTTQPYTNTEGTLEFYNCSCTIGQAPLYSGLQSNITVLEGPCPLDCGLLYSVFIWCGFIVFFFTFVMGSPLTVSTLRVVPEKQRSFAVSVQWVFLRFLGSIPGPIIFGTIIDSSCSLWEEDCNVKGSCWVYDNFEMSKRLFILIFVLKLLSILFNTLALVLYKPPHNSAQPAQELTPENKGMTGNGDSTLELVNAENKPHTK